MKKIFIYLILFLSLIFIYARFIEVNNFIVKEYQIINNKIPEEFNGYKIIQISDLYYDGKDINNIIDRINLLKADLVLFTGDLLKNNTSKENQDKLIEYLNKIESNYGIYYCQGDNDQTNEFKYVIEKTKFKQLDNNYEYLYNGSKNTIMLLGSGLLLDNEKFNYEDNNNFKIMISHKPDNIEKLEKEVDLYLSGHTLNGQIRLPLVGGIIYKDRGKYYEEKYTINNTTIYISNGLGTPGYDIRLFNTPSINFFRLYNK